jgi:hypothetical protein
MPKHCYELDFNIPLLRCNIDPNDYKDYVNTLYIYDYINMDILKLLYSLNLKLDKVGKLFFSKPFESSPIHVDILGVKDIVKINFTQNALGSYLNWYTICNGNYKSNIFPEGSTLFDKSEIKFLHSQPLPKLALVQGGPPHNVVTGPEERITISITPVTKNNEPIPMEQAINIFSRYIV